MEPNAKIIIYAGIIIVVIGIIYYYFGAYFTWIGRMPGDIRVDKENFSFYFPITTMIIISIVINLLIRLYSYLSQ